VNTFDFLLQGLAIAAQPINLFYALIGVTLGTLVGVLPGIGPALTVALLLPVTYQLDPAGSLIMFAGIYYGGMYGGSTTSILLNTPGESASIVTALEGNKMARAGRGGPALATAAIGSFVAGLLATISLAFIAPFVVKFALSFGPREYFALMVLAFVTVSAAFGDSTLRGLTALFIGLAFSIVGIDQLTGQTRLSFGVPDLLDGLEVTTLAVAMFAIGETLYVAAQGDRAPEKVEPVKGSLWMTKSDWMRSWKPWLRGTAIGFPIGAMSAGGADVSSFLSYSFGGKELLQTSGGIRPRCNRRRCRTGGCQQCVGCRYTCAPADAWSTYHSDGRDHAGGLPAIRASARAAVVCHQSAACLGPDCVPADR
jgi:putative tricarboxylic transport membrane protein